MWPEAYSVSFASTVAIAQFSMTMRRAALSVAAMGLPRAFSGGAGTAGPGDLSAETGGLAADSTAAPPDAPGAEFGKFAGVAGGGPGSGSGGYCGAPDPGAGPVPVRTTGW
ncbi:hypothetical protein GCM10009731_28330 [Streptomyces globosus]